MRNREEKKTVRINGLFRYYLREKEKTIKKKKKQKNKKIYAGKKEKNRDIKRDIKGGKNLRGIKNGVVVGEREEGKDKI